MPSAIICHMALGQRPKLLVNCAAIAFLIVLFTGTTEAGPIIWKVDASFADGGALTGAFEFDTTQTQTNAALSYSLTVSGGDTSVFRDLHILQPIPFQEEASVSPNSSSMT